MTDIFREILIETGLSALDAQRIISSAPIRYKQYHIEKRNGGTRLIAQPSRELKVLQRFLLSKFLRKLPVHKAAMAYAPGRNIFDNANSHKGASVLLKLDFENFFPSIKVSDWVSYVKRECPEWIKLGYLPYMTKILFWGQGTDKPKCLSIGAPTSPILSNILMYDMDVIFYRGAKKLGLKYTRYADDITVSGGSRRKVLIFEGLVRSTLKEMASPRLRINEKKRGIYDRGEKMLVTGLIITPPGDVSIGRERKRKISSLIHKFMTGDLPDGQIGYLKGMLGFSIANEVDFVRRMREKYGDAPIDEILKTVIKRKGVE